MVIDLETERAKRRKPVLPLDPLDLAVMGAP